MANGFYGCEIRSADDAGFMKWLAVFVTVACLANPAYANPNDAIVLLHGFWGIGRTEMAEVKYWGGIGQDYEEMMNQAGYPTVSVAVGPVSSNWDRALEAYYQLKGGCVDYGEAHAKRFGHERFGRCYQKPLLSRWNEEHKVSIIAHSQGGQTARVLIHLLEYGDREEQAASGVKTADIFKGGHAWVRSLTTLSTPHNGTTLTKGASSMTFNMEEQLITGIAGFVQGNEKLCALYDFKLDQWGVKRLPGETYKSYRTRIKNSPIVKLQAKKDMALWDLSPEGARELNGWVKNSPNVYYFSISTASTEKDESTSEEYPVFTNALIFLPAAHWMGSYRNLDPLPGEVKIDDTWAKNDSVVNTISMKGPAGSVILPYDGKPRKGVWQDMGTWSTWDHMDIIGQTRMWNLLDSRNPKDFYLNHAEFLRSLN